MLPVDFVILIAAAAIAVVLVTAFYGYVTGVPYVPTSVPVARAMIGMARLRGTETVFDLGAGNGRILIEAKRKYPSVSATGIELAPTVWLLGKLTVALRGSGISFLRGDARTIDLRSADVIFLYLFPGMMASLEEKFDRELRPGTVVISHSFRFPRRQPSETTVLERWGTQKTLLRYEW